MMTLAKTKLLAAVTAAAVVAGIGGMAFVNRATAQDQRDAVQRAAAQSPKAEKDAKTDEKPSRNGWSVESALPVVVKTVPQAGADDVAPGLTEIRVTFSKEMIDGNWSFPQVSKETAVKSTGKPRFEDDGHTCVLPVKLEPGKTYVIPINKPPFNSFMDKGHRRAMEYMLVFETKKE